MRWAGLQPLLTLPSLRSRTRASFKIFSVHIYNVEMTSILQLFSSALLKKNSGFVPGGKGMPAGRGMHAVYVGLRQSDRDERLAVRSAGRSARTVATGETQAGASARWTFRMPLDRHGACMHGI